MPQINQQQSQSRGNGNSHRIPNNHEQEQEHGALIIDQADEVILEEDGYETATKIEQGQNDQEWQPAVQCPLCNEYFENKAAVKLHRYQVQIS